MMRITKRDTVSIWYPNDLDSRTFKTLYWEEADWCAEILDEAIDTIRSKVLLRKEK